MTIDELLAFVWDNPYSDFYRKKYEQAGLTREVVLDSRNFMQLPLLTKQEMEAVPARDRLHIADSDVRFIAYTSGTTSQQPFVTYFGDVDNYYFDPTLGFDVHRLLITYPPLNKHFGHTFIQQCRQSPKTPVPVFADFQQLPAAAVIAARTEVDAIYATPTIAAMLAEHLHEHYDTGRIKLLALGSETVTLARRKQLEALYPNARIADLYASSEIGQFALYPCKHMIEEGQALLHVLTPPVIATELIDDELVVTFANNKAMPLVRYRTGDYFEAVAHHCPCGVEGPVLRWLGRMGVDRIRAGGVEIRIADLDAALFDVAHLVGTEYQAHFYEEVFGSQSKIKVIIEIPESVLVGRSMSPELIRFSVLDHLMQSWHLAAHATLRDAVARGLFVTPEIMFVPQFSVQGVKARKLVNHIVQHA